MIVDGYKLTAFTHLSEVICTKVLNIVQREFGEIGFFLIEDDEVGFRVYRGYFEEAPRLIKAEEIKLKLIEKCDYNYSLGYQIYINRPKL